MDATDVAGKLMEFTELQTTTNGSEKMDITLENNRYTSLNTDLS